MKYEESKERNEWEAKKVKDTVGKKKKAGKREGRKE